MIRIPKRVKLLDMLFLLVFTFYSLTPVIWVGMTSLKTDPELLKNGTLALPNSFYLGNYPEAWRAANFSQYFANSIIITVLTVVIIALLSLMLAYSLCYLSFPGKAVVNYLILFGLMIPFELIMIPLFHNMKSMGLINTRWAIILPQVALWLPFSVFLLLSFMRDLPASLVDSARIDGAKEFRIMWSIVVPLLKPALISVSIFNLISSWNNYMLPTIMITSDKYKTITLGLDAFKTKFSMNVTLTCTAAVIIALPVIIFYLFFQRKLISGLTVGAVKE